MRLNLIYSEADEALGGYLEFMDRRRYVVRAMVPAGYETYFQQRARYISAHTSTAIEGNPLREEEAMVILAEGGSADDPRALAKINLDEAYELMALLASDKSTRVDQGIIRTMNSITLKGLSGPGADNRGKYRLGQNLVRDSDTREIRYRPPPPEWVPELMAEFVKDINRWLGEYPVPIAAALAHFGLISIHPFDDGNGRTARLVADMILDIGGWSVEGMLSISSVLWDRRQDYYEALRTTQGLDFGEEIDATPFVRFHTLVLRDAVTILEERVVYFNMRRDSWIREIDFLNPRQVTALMFMVDVGPLSSSIYARLTKSSQGTALADLAQMVERNLATRVGAGKSTRYRLSPTMARSIQGNDAGGEA